MPRPDQAARVSADCRAADAPLGGRMFAGSRSAARSIAVWNRTRRYGRAFADGMCPAAHPDGLSRLCDRWLGGWGGIRSDAGGPAIGRADAAGGQTAVSDG